MLKSAGEGGGVQVGVYAPSGQLVEAASCKDQEASQANHNQTETLEHLVH